MELWTPLHAMTLLPAMAVMVILTVILQLTIGKKSREIRIIPLQVIAVILVVLEIAKQIFSISHRYDLYHIPLHFCSLFLFTLPVAAFYKGKHQGKIMTVTAAVGASLLLFMLIYPNLVYDDASIAKYFKFDEFLAFHTVTFHNLALWSVLLIVGLRLYELPEKGESLVCVLFMLGFCTVAGIMAQIHETNYANMYRCNIAPIDDLRVAISREVGYPLAQTAYVIGVSLAHMGFYMMSFGFFCLLRRLGEKLYGKVLEKRRGTV